MGRWMDTDRSAWVRPRRRYTLQRSLISGLLLGGLASLGAVLLRRLGAIRHLPDPPLRAFDSDAAIASRARRRPAPDALFDIIDQAATIALAVAGGVRRHRRDPVVPILLAGKLAIDAWHGGARAAADWRVRRAVDAWSLLASIASLAALPLAIPEARAGLRDLRVRGVRRRYPLPAAMLRRTAGVC